MSWICKAISGDLRLSETQLDLIPLAMPDGTYLLSITFMRNDDLEVSTHFVDWHDSRVSTILLDKAQRRMGGVSRDWFLRNRDGIPQFSPVCFSYVIDDLVAIPHFGSTSADPSDYGMPLAKVIQDAGALSKIKDESLLLEQLKCEAGEITIWHRMPAESRFFGYPIRAAVVSSHAGYTQWYANLTARDVGLGRLRVPDKEIDFKAMPEGAASHDPDTILASFTSTPPGDWVADLRVSLDLAFARYEREAGTKLSPEQVRERELHLLGLLRQTASGFDLHLHDGKSIFLDPYIRGLSFEQAFWRPEIHSTPMMHRILQIMDDLHYRGGALSYSLLCRVADIGVCPNWMSHTLLYRANEFKEGEKAGLPNHESAALLVRWNMPTEAIHVDATLQSLNDAKDDLVKYDCVETLMRMNAIDRVPKDVLEEWFQRSVVEAKERRRVICTLMHYEGGRALLANRFKVRHSAPEFWATLQEIVANEVRAAAELGDHPYFSKENLVELSDRFSLVDKP